MGGGTLSRRLSVWLSWILGGISALVGIVTTILALTAWGPIRESLSRVSEGLREAESAIDLMGSDFGSSSSLVTQIASSIRSTSSVIHETSTVLGEIMETTTELRDFTNEVRMGIENLPGTIRSLMGPDQMSGVTVSLARTHAASGEALLRMEHLAEALTPVEVLLIQVADGVDSLSGDLFSTEAAFGEASGNLEGAADAIDQAAGSSFLPVVAVLASMIPLLVGVYLVIQGMALRRLYLEAPPMRETTE